MRLLISLFLTGIGWSVGCVVPGYDWVSDIPITSVAAGTLTNKVVLVTGTYTFLKTVGNGGLVTNVNAYDVCFTDAGNSTAYVWELPIGIYVATTGKFTAYVTIPSLTAGANTLKMYIGNSGVTTFQGGTGVWDTDYKGIYHLIETNNPYVDSSTAGNNASKIASPTQTAGPSYDFGQTLVAASSQAFDFDNNIINTSPALATTSALIKLTSLPGAMIVIDTRDPTGLLGIALFIDGSGFSSCLVNDIGTSANGVSLNDGMLHHVACAFNGTGVTGYVDGVSSGTVTSGTGFNGWAAPTTKTNIGRVVVSGSGVAYFDGLIQEAHISNSARSANWIAVDADMFLNPGNIVVGTPASTSGATSARRRILGL